ncbi:MAG: hypothetical protein IT449_02480 [Phycisphaerales bacterium]|nr:hypothetical protein [Phycisphaerales bacterium]
MVKVFSLAGLMAGLLAGAGSRAAWALPQDSGAGNPQLASSQIQPPPGDQPPAAGKKGQGKKGKGKKGKGKGKDAAGKADGAQPKGEKGAGKKPVPKIQQPQETPTAQTPPAQSTTPDAPMQEGEQKPGVEGEKKAPGEKKSSDDGAGKGGATGADKKLGQQVNKIEAKDLARELLGDEGDGGRQGDGKAQPGGAPQGEPRRSDVPFKNMSGEDILGVINTMDLGLTGADLQVEIVGKNIVIKGAPEDVEKLEALVLLLDRLQKDMLKSVETVVLKQKGAEEISRAVTDALRDVFPMPTGRAEQPFKISPIGGNVVLIVAMPEHMDFIKDVVTRLDELPPPELGEWLTFEIKNRKASDVLKEVQDMLSKIRTQLGVRTGELAIKAIDATNQLQVFAPEKERDRIQKIIDAVDVAPKEDWGEVKMVMFPLLHSKAEDFVNTLNDLLTSQEGRDAATETILRLSLMVVDPKTGAVNPIKPIDLSRTNKLIADPGTNSILVATVEKNIPGFAELIRLLDGIPLAEDVQVELVPLRFAEASDLEEKLSTLFESGPDLLPDPGDINRDGVPKQEAGKALAYKFSVVADSRSNTIVLAGRAEQVSLAKRVVEGLDQPFRYKHPIRMIRLQNGDAIRIGKLLTDMLEQRQDAYNAVANDMAAEAERVFLTIDVNSNALIVSASEPNIAEIESLVKTLDIAPTRNLTQLGIIKCHHLSATTLAEKIKELWERKLSILDEAEQFRDEPVIVADERSNSLLVAAGPDDFAQIQQLVENLEKEKPVDNIRIFGLKFADAMQMKTKFEELFQGLSPLIGEENEPTFISDERSNSLIVAASQDAMERVETLVTKLDVESGPTTAILQAYTLQFANALNIAQKMTRLFEDRQQGGDSGERTPVVIVPFEGTNSLVISASRDDHAVVTDLMRLLDQKSALAKQVEIFPLQYAKAEDASQSLEELFNQASSDGDSGRPDAIAVVPDARSNSLVVWASASQLEDVAAMIKKLDTTNVGPRQSVRVVQLKQALAEDFATVLQDAIFGENEDENTSVMISFQETRDDGTKVEHKLLRQDVRFTPDARTNSIFVYAPEKSIDALESMIRNIDQIRPTVNEIRMFELWNSNAQSVVEMLRDLYEQDTGGQQGEADIRTQFQVMGFPIEGIPALAGQSLRFVADERTNTVVAAGAPIDLQMIEGLVRTLDSVERNERVDQVYRPNTLKPDELSTALTDFLQQEEEAYPQDEGTTSSYQLAEKKVSIVSIGGDTEEDRGSGLMIGSSPRKAPQILDLIQQLDRPEPQVRISVLVAEVILDDRLELGIEFAAQDLEFSETAVLGPNGTVIGDNDAFDTVSGTDIGAVGPGGFSFTVTGEDFNFLLRALQTESRLEVLSRPTIVVENNRVGNIDIGDRIPIPKSSNLSDTSARTQTSFDYEDVGIKLNVTPHITPDSFVRMDVSAEISQLSNQTITLTEGLTAPVINQRKLESSVTVKDGETVVLGGLITSSQEHGENKVPVFGDLPWVGVLFRSTREVSRRTELLTILTVEVLRTPEDYHETSLIERDMGESSDWIKSHRLMEGLRIVPDPSMMGPQEEMGPNGQPAPNGAAPAKPTPQGRELYGPKPRRYGPDLSKPVAKYGPKLPAQKPLPPPPPPPVSEEKPTAELAGGPNEER